MNPSQIAMAPNMASAQPQMQGINPAKPRILTGEDAVSILNLVNVDGEVLDIPALKKDAVTLTKIAAEIIKTRKNGGQIEFENGRILIPKKIFESIVRSAESPQKGPEQVFTQVKDNGGILQKSGQKPASGQVNAQNVGMFAPPPVQNDSKSRKTKTKDDRTSSSSIASAQEEESDGTMPELTLSQAYSILVDVAAPNGGRYVMHASGEYDDTPERKLELEASLEQFWKDFGHTISVNGKHTCFVIRPKMIIGGNINSEVSKKLVVVYLSQSTAEKISRGTITVTYKTVTIKTRNGKSMLEITNKKIVSELTVICGMQQKEAEPNTAGSYASNPFGAYKAGQPGMAMAR